MKRRRRTTGDFEFIPEPKDKSAKKWKNTKEEDKTWKSPTTNDSENKISRLISVKEPKESR